MIVLNAMVKAVDHIKGHVSSMSLTDVSVLLCMIGYLDHCIRDNHMPMAMSTLLPSNRQRKDTSNDLSHDILPLPCATAFHDHAVIAIN